MTFIERLDYQMAKRSLNKHTLAALADVPYTTVVGFYTKGYSNVRMSTVRKLAVALNISTDYLVDEDITDENGHPEPPLDMLMPPDAMKIAKRYDLLDEYGKNAVEKIIDCEEIRIAKERR